MLCSLIVIVCSSPCVAEPKLPTPPSGKFKLRYVHTYITSGTRTPLTKFLPAIYRGNWICDSGDAYSGRISANDRRIRHMRDISSLEFPVSCSLGELTVDGMDQLQNLGVAFRKYLVKENDTFLSNDYINPYELYVRAASKDRNYRTAVSFLGGLYPPAMPDEQVDIFVGGETRDILTPDPSSCQDLSQLKESYLRTSFPAELNRLSTVLATAIDELQVRDLSYETLYSMCDFIIQMDCQDNYLVNVTSEQVEECKKTNALLRTGIYTQNRAVAASYGLRELKRVLIRTISGTSNSKMSIFAVDEDEIIALLIAFGQTVSAVPPAASSLLLEVYISGGNDYIRICYNGNALTIPGLEAEESLYKLHDLMTLIEPMTEFCREMP